MKENELGRRYGDGEIICREGEEGKSMFVIQSGSVKVSKKLPESEMVLRILTQGEIFGEMSLFDHKPRSATVEAQGEVVVLKIDKEGFFEKASEDPTLAFNILEGMSNRIRELTSELAKYKESTHLVY